MDFECFWWSDIRASIGKDEIPSYLSNEEFVVSAPAVNEFVL